MSFDLEINNYKKKELEDIFELPPNYTSSILEQNESKLRESILSDKSINETTKTKTISFLKAAKNILLDDLNQFQDITLNVVHETKVNNNANNPYALQPSEVVSAGNTFIIEPKRSVLNGTINPININTQTKYLNIDSRLRFNYYAQSSTDFSIELPIKIVNVISMSLISFEMPSTYLAISQKNDNSYFAITIPEWNLPPPYYSGPLTQVITIPDGNYTTVGFLAYLNNYCGGTGPLAAFPYFNRIIFTLNQDIDGSGSGKTIIGIKPKEPSDFITPDIFNFNIDFTADAFAQFSILPDGVTNRGKPVATSLGWMMGFREARYVGNCSYASEGIIDLTGTKYVYLVVDDFHQNYSNVCYGAYTDSLLNKAIIGRIRTQNSPSYNYSIANILNFLAYTPMNRQYFGPVDIQKLKIQILDEFGRIFAINNMDISLLLSFECLYST